MCHDIDVPALLPAVVDRVQSSLPSASSPAKFTVADTGVGYEQVNGSDVTLSVIDERPYCHFVANIDDVRDTIDRRRNGRRRFSFKVRDDDANSVSAEPAAYRATDTVAATSDDGYLDSIAHSDSNSPPSR